MQVFACIQTKTVSFSGEGVGSEFTPPNTLYLVLSWAISILSFSTFNHLGDHAFCSLFSCLPYPSSAFYSSNPLPACPPPPFNRGVTALKKAVWAEPCVNKSPSENLEYHPKFFGRHSQKSQLSRNLTSLPRSPPPPQISQVPQFLAKSSDS